MRQFVLPRGADIEGPIRISGADCKYILKVLRLGIGDSFPATDYSGNRFSLEITAADGNSFTAKCRSENIAPARDGKSNRMFPGVFLFQCLPKGKKLEMIVRQAVEAGVTAIVPVESRNSVAVIKEERSGKRAERLGKIAEEAAQQSGNRGVPKIYTPIKMSGIPEFLQSVGFDGLRLFFHEKRLDKGSLHRYLKNGSESVLILIGPEGGFSAEETDFLLASGFYPVYLGENVLRTETAAIYALGAVNTILLEKNEWKTDIRE